MKKLFYLFAILTMAFGFTACSSDDDDSPSGKFVHSTYGEVGSVKYFMYPTRDWGCSKSKVKDFMQGYSIYDETDKDITFIGKYRETLTMYFFESDALKSAGISLRFGEFDGGVLAEMVKKDYNLVSNNGNDFRYNCKDNKSSLLVSFSEKSVELVWKPGTISRSADDDSDKYISELRELAKSK